MSGGTVLVYILSKRGVNPQILDYFYVKSKSRHLQLSKEPKDTFEDLS